METKTIWLDGKLVVPAEATCAISCASLMGGMVVLEDAPLFKNERGSFVFRVDDHVKQFERSAKIAQIELPYTSNKLAKAALKVAKASVADGCGEGIVRFVAYFGGAASIDGLLPSNGQASVAIFCMPLSSEAESISAGGDARPGCGDSLSGTDGEDHAVIYAFDADGAPSCDEGASLSKGDSFCDVREEVCDEGGAASCDEGALGDASSCDTDSVGDSSCAVIASATKGACGLIEEQAAVEKENVPEPVACSASSDAPGKSAGSNCAVDSEMATVGISSWRAISNNALPPQAELAASRANAAFALREARQRGFDEPILLNEVGDVCSGARKAVFAVRDGVLSTPPLACGVRESVERDTAINFAMDLDVPIVEERMTRADLCIADELFLCDAVRGVIPISSIDGCAIGKPGKTGPKPGPITKAIQERHAKMFAGKLDEYAAWLVQVE